LRAAGAINPSMDGEDRVPIVIRSARVRQKKTADRAVFHYLTAEWPTRGLIAYEQVWRTPLAPI
jgi:hypothetical protein